MFQRPQQIMRQFAKHGWTVYYCNKTQIKKPMEEIEPNLFLVHDWEEFLKSGKHIDIFYSTWAACHTYIEKINHKMVVYDSVDDFEVWRQFEPHMIKKSHLVFTTSELLFNMRKKVHDHVFLIRNGCDYEFINSNSNKPMDLQRIKTPIVAFIGYLGDWVNRDILNEVGKNFTTVFIGDKGNNEVPKSLIDLGYKNYKEIPMYYNNISVGLIPFNKCDVSQAANPIKMYEYLSAGKPVVATNNPECCLYPEVVLSSKNVYDFLENIKKALTLNIALQAKEIAKENSWEKRFEEIEKRIKERYGR
jgi:glycosyltransferase involved in cell wall biosynthesis